VQEWNNVLDVNLQGVVHGCAVFAPIMYVSLFSSLFPFPLSPSPFPTYPVRLMYHSLYTVPAKPLGTLDC
jgi:hypothetical protein